MGGTERTRWEEDGLTHTEDDLLLLPEDVLIEFLVRLPAVSLLRFKVVCKSWLALIESSSFTDLYSKSSSSSSSFNSNKSGSFILHTAVDHERFRENGLTMLSFVSESEFVSRGGRLTPQQLMLKLDDTDNDNDNDNDDQQQQLVLKLDDTDNDDQLQLDDTDNDNDDQQQLVLSLEKLGFPNKILLILENLGFPNKILESPTVMVVGSCNGLVCLYDEQPNEISLCNPATRKFKILPKPITKAAAGNGDVRHLFAFGVDYAETKDDYKVVLLSVFNQRMLDFEIVGPVAMKCICRVQVYSSSTNSWKLLEGITCLPGSPFPYPPDSSSELFYLNGCCFFMAKLLYSEQCTPPPPKRNDRFMISLDLTKETITPIQLPDHHYYRDLYLCYMGMKIAVFAKLGYNDPPGSGEIFDIWVFNEPRSSSVGDDESWTKVCYFEIRLGLQEHTIPRGISNDGVFALLETKIRGGLGNKTKRKMKLYNIATNEMKMNFLSCDQVLSKAYAYKPSSVWISGTGRGC